MTMDFGSDILSSLSMWRNTKTKKPALASSPRRLHENREGVFPARTSIHMGIAIFNV
ncbi:hypothetical protein GM692_12450 [Brucella abortus]|nr:hypothetical protein [Brucella sp. 10RB9213]MUJ17019.1 hypothetical protein [Brucella abortus]MWC02559.1 hypothetical protein [Brucella melitensis]QIS28517.1 hypothetical protein F6460_08435 [Brucella abortus RB51-AHVLA]MUJ30986.1 hypothetical protein [Brucella abortus]